MKKLFKSKTAFELIDFFTKNPKGKYYAAELAKGLGKDLANVTRELSRLVKEDIVEATSEKGKKAFYFNESSRVADELAALFQKQRAESEDRFAGDWMLAEEIKNLAPDFSQIWLNCFVDAFAKPSGKAYKKIACIHRGYHLWFYFDAADADAVGENLVDRFVREPQFMTKVNAEIIHWADKLRSVAAGLPETNLEKLSSAKLWKQYKDYYETHHAYYQWCWIPVASDMFTENLTKRGKRILKEYGVSEKDVNETLAMLTTPTAPSPLKEEQESLMRIGIAVQKDRVQAELFTELMRKFKEEEAKQYGLYTHSLEYEQKFEERVRDLEGRFKPNIQKALQEHYAKYFFTKWIYTEEQGVYSFEHYLKSLVRLVANEQNLARTLADEQKAFATSMQNRDKLMKNMKLSALHRQFFTEWGNFMVTKIYRRFAQLFALYKATPLVEEIARRAGITLKEARFLMPQEMERVLAGKTVDIGEVQKRSEFCVYYADKTSREFITGREAEKIAAKMEIAEKNDVQEIHGQTGCPGIAKGAVKIINVMADMKKMEKGDILVAISTQPDLLPAMKKAAAFVTDQGGVTSHAAIVAREINTPCVIGTKIATKVLKDGDVVEVDATKGMVRKILK